LSQLRDLVRAELKEPVDPRVRDLAAAVAARHDPASRAVLFYGSCLRERQLEGLMLDFYLIVSDYRSAYDKRWMATANRLIPPNVFLIEHEGLRAKYAVLSEADFQRLNGPETRNPSVWARFAQPSRLVWSSDLAAEGRTIASVARAAPTLLCAALAELPNEQSELDLWRGAFALTYAAELRAEKKSKGGSVVDADPERYRRFTAPALAAARAEGRRRHSSWRRRKIEGKALSVLRLAKASATFAGGADYIAWKINRHAGTDIQLRPWQRRWPLLAALTLAPRLLRSRAIR
jgi:hypothetical protein